MKLKEYLDTVSEQIRYAPMRAVITEELQNHILDQASVYEAGGCSAEEAMKRAVKEMGDPVETGVSLDRIHRPRMNWMVISLIGLISLLGVGIIYYTNIKAHDLFEWQTQFIYALLGFILMLIVCRVDYSILSKCNWMVGMGYLAVAAIISHPEFLFLYVPIFGAVLYNFRGDGYTILPKVIPFIVIPCCLLVSISNAAAGAILFTCLLGLFLFTVWKSWYHVNSKLVCGIGSSLLFVLPVVLFVEGKTVGYVTDIVRAILESSVLLGSSDRATELFVRWDTTSYVTDYILVAMCSIYGIFATVIVFAAVMFLVFKVFQIAIEQKNQLGMVVGAGCGLVFLMKVTVGILMNLQIIPYIPLSIPFLSYGGSSTIVSYILLGLVLSIYRYKNILPNKPQRRRMLKVSYVYKDI